MTETFANDIAQRLAEVDRNYREAGLNFRERWADARAAASAEEVARLQKICAYNEVFANGFVIEEIVEPTKLKYTVPVEIQFRAGLFGKNDITSKTLVVDSDHAQKIIGQTATDTHFTIDKSPSQPQEIQCRLGEQAEELMTFTLNGDFRNQSEPTTALPRTSTTYICPLVAIKYVLL